MLSGRVKTESASGNNRVWYYVRMHFGYKLIAVQPLVGYMLHCALPILLDSCYPGMKSALCSNWRHRVQLHSVPGRDEPAVRCMCICLPTVPLHRRRPRITCTPHPPDTSLQTHIRLTRSVLIDPVKFS